MPQKERLSILIVNYNTADFINLSLFALKNLTSNPYKVFIIDNNSKIKDYKKLQKYCKKYSNISLERSTTNLIGSMAHGTALNILIKKVDTPYFSILDADATWLKKDWDETLISQFTNTIKVIGTQAPQPKPQDFPLMFAILFESETFRKLKIDFRPNDLSKNQDTGWEIREKYLNAGYEGITIEFKNTRTYKEGPFGKLLGVGEFYLNQDYSQIFASHFGRGSNPFAKQKFNSKYQIFNIILSPINYILWVINKQKWIKICTKIILQQTKRRC